MSRLQRELRPALTPTEIAEADDVHRHAFQQDIKLRANAPVKVIIRCNQLDPTFAACQWSKKIETSAADSVHRSKLALREHLLAAHPYLTPLGLAKVLGATWVNMRDIGG